MLCSSRWIRAALVAAASWMVSQQAVAQGARTIVGSYNLDRNHQPEGGTHLFLLPDSTYVVAYFGGARVGRWRVDSDSLLFLTPTDVPARPFALYGRHHSGLRGKTRIFYTGSFNRAVYVGWGGVPAGGIRAVRRVYNEDANCLSFPTVDTFAAIPDSISLLQPGEAGARHGDVYTFPNPEGFNDFVATNSDRATADDGPSPDEPIGVLRAGGIYLFGSRHLAQRGELPTGEEDLAFFATLTRTDPEPDTVLYNPRYRLVAELGDDEPFAPASYTPLPGRDMLVTKQGYEEGVEYAPDYDFHDMRVLYLFRAVTPTAVREERFRVEEPPVFYFSCDD